MGKWDYISASELEARIGMTALEAINVVMTNGGDPAEKIGYIEGIRRMTLMLIAHVRTDGKKEGRDEDED